MVWNHRLVRHEGKICFAEVYYTSHGTPYAYANLSENDDGTLEGAKKYVEEEYQRLEKGKNWIIDVSALAHIQKQRNALFHNIHGCVPTDASRFSDILKRFEGKNLETITPEEVEKILIYHP